MSRKGIVIWLLLLGVLCFPTTQATEIFGKDVDVNSDDWNSILAIAFTIFFATLFLVCICIVITEDGNHQKECDEQNERAKTIFIAQTDRLEEYKRVRVIPGGAGGYKMWS
jgi:lysylphosphatidylglycerol synthetase-like protein (DUF2156 family)